MKLYGEWKKLSGSVYEAKTGTRIHTLNVIKFKIYGTIFFSCANYSKVKELDKMVKICGGNNKRGLMLFAECYESSGFFRNKVNS